MQQVQNINQDNGTIFEFRLIQDRRQWKSLQLSIDSLDVAFIYFVKASWMHLRPLIPRSNFIERCIP